MAAAACGAICWFGGYGYISFAACFLLIQRVLDFAGRLGWMYAAVDEIGQYEQGDESTYHDRPPFDQPATSMPMSQPRFLSGFSHLKFRSRVSTCPSPSSFQ